MTKNRGEVDGNSILHFYGELNYVRHDDCVLVVCPNSANWIVLDSEVQVRMLQRLSNGMAVGNTLELDFAEDKLSQMRILLAKLFAREMVRLDEDEICPVKLNGYKMLNIYLTNACNLRCDHCFMQSGMALKNELNGVEWMRLLECFKQNGGESVTFSGGEPLMHRDFVAIIRKSHSLGLTVTVLSNGVLWNETLIQELAPYISEIQISIDGFDEDSNAKVRGNGHFENVVRNVVLFAHYGVRTSVATTFTWKNLEENAGIRYKELVERIQEQTNHSVFFKLSKKILRGRNTDYSEVENKLFFEKIVAIEKLVDADAQLANFMEGHTPNSVAANCGFGGVSIGANGDVYFCNRISEVECWGNVRETPLTKLLKKGIVLHETTDVDHIQPCKDCYLRYVCGGGCRIDDFNFHGKVQNAHGEYANIKCDEQFRYRLERKMIDGFRYKYKF